MIVPPPTITVLDPRNLRRGDVIMIYGGARLPWWRRPWAWLRGNDLVPPRPRRFVVTRIRGGVVSIGPSPR